MRVCCLCELDELAPYADAWDRMSGNVPFRSWAWLSTWWRHYGRRDGSAGGRARLFVPCVFDHDNTLVGLAPWYLERHGATGRVVRPLGSGEVCSEHLTVLCQPGMEHQVTRALADHLTSHGHRGNNDPPRWDLLELTDFDAEDAVIALLIGHLAERGNTVHRQPGPYYWRIELPATWDDYLAMLSKSHRKQLRRLERRLLAVGRAVLHPIARTGDLPRGIDLLVYLHQRRRRSLGEPGCFSSARFTAFCREVMPKLLAAGQLQLDWLEIDGRPVAVEFHLVGGGVVYAYQAGVHPESLHHEPGKLITLAILRRAIEQGFRAFDFLRGNEFYKPHFRAIPHTSLTVRVVPNRTAAQLRHNVWQTGNQVKRWVKAGLKLVETLEK